MEQNVPNDVWNRTYGKGIYKNHQEERYRKDINLRRPGDIGYFCFIVSDRNDKPDGL
jgi:hypothetical protein